MRIRLLAAAVVASVSTLAAPQAQAATFVFDVHVTERLGDPSFSGLTFKQTWEFTPSPFTRAFAGAPTYTQYLASPVGQTSAVVSKSPLYADVLAAGGSPSLTPEAMVHALARTTLTGGVPSSTQLIASFSNDVFEDTPLDDGSFRSRYYSNEMIVHYTLPEPNGGKLTAARFANFLETASPIGWNEWAEDDIVVTIDGTPWYYPQSSVAYIGTATFDRGASVVPEPEGWALLIAGFAGVGAVARRHRGVWNS